MNILTPTKLAALMNEADFITSTEMKWQIERLENLANAVSSAVIKKLAQGVSVERLKNIDWQQFAMHGGEPCFDLDRDGSLCGRARHWAGHDAPGSFVSLHDFVSTAIAAARVQALIQAEQVVLADCVKNPVTEYQRQYNITLQSTAAAIRALIGKEST